MIKVFSKVIPGVTPTTRFVIQTFILIGMSDSVKREREGKP